MYKPPHSISPSLPPSLPVIDVHLGRLALGPQRTQQQNGVLFLDEERGPGKDDGTKKKKEGWKSWKKMKMTLRKEDGAAGGTSSGSEPGSASDHVEFRSSFRPSATRVFTSITDTLAEADLIIDDGDVVPEEDTDEITFMIDHKLKRSCVKSATIERLLERLTHAIQHDTSFRNSFLLTFPAFMEPRDFFQMLAARFSNPILPPDLEPLQATKAIHFRYALLSLSLSVVGNRVRHMTHRYRHHLVIIISAACGI